MNVTELARKLKMNTKDLLELLPALGFDIGKRAIKIDPYLVDKIVTAVENYRSGKKQEQQQKLVQEIKLGEREKKKEVKLEKVVKIPEIIVVNELANKMGIPVTKLIAELFKNGIMASLNERIDFETAVILGEDLGFKIEKLSAEEQLQEQSLISEKKLKELIKDRGDKLQARPPVVIVMGHVDHGKTKLLDAIRQTNVVAQEAGGITQHIGAYQVTVPPTEVLSSRAERGIPPLQKQGRDDGAPQGRAITFLDTPGHEAFKAMRSRGSRVADLAIIVIAADDGLQPQTLEVIEMAQKENLPFVIAINKIDKEGADIDRVKKELSEINLIPEDWSGKTICVPISAKQKIGITELLDMVLLVAEMEELKADSTLPAVGTIIETHIDKGEGPVATVLIQSGTLKVGDLVVVGEVAGKIRAMRDFRGNFVVQASPAMPVKLLGLKSTPQVGDILEVTSDRKKIKEFIKQSSYKRMEAQLVKTASASVKADQQPESAKAAKEEPSKNLIELNIVLKCDVLGSQEAISEALNKITDPEIKINLIKKGLGNVTEVDVLTAEAAKALIIAFQVVAQPMVEKLVQEKSVEILYFKIIYQLLDEIEQRLKKLLPSQIIRTELGKIKVLAIFRTEKNFMIIGGKVVAGRIRPQTKIKVTRGTEVVTTGDLIELRSGKEVVTEAVIGEECGLSFKGEPLIKIGDLLEVYQEEVKKRELTKS